MIIIVHCKHRINMGYIDIHHLKMMHDVLAYHTNSNSINIFVLLFTNSTFAQSSGWEEYYSCDKAKISYKYVNCKFLKLGDL